jgi:hypothetical protein
MVVGKLLRLSGHGEHDDASYVPDEARAGRFGRNCLTLARERILADGSEPVGNDPETFRKYMLADMIKWAKLVKESGAKL